MCYNVYLVKCLWCGLKIEDNVDIFMGYPYAVTIKEAHIYHLKCIENLNNKNQLLKIECIKCNVEMISIGGPYRFKILDECWNDSKTRAALFSGDDIAMKRGLLFAFMSHPAVTVSELLFFYESTPILNNQLVSEQIKLYNQYFDTFFERNPLNELVAKMMVAAINFGHHVILAKNILHRCSRTFKSGVSTSIDASICANHLLMFITAISARKISDKFFADFPGDIFYTSILFQVATTQMTKYAAVEMIFFMAKWIKCRDINTIISYFGNRKMFDDFLTSLRSAQFHELYYQMMNFALQLGYGSMLYFESTDEIVNCLVLADEYHEGSSLYLDGRYPEISRMLVKNLHLFSNINLLIFEGFIFDESTVSIFNLCCENSIKAKLKSFFFKYCTVKSMFGAQMLSQASQIIELTLHNCTFHDLSDTYTLLCFFENIQRLHIISNTFLNGAFSSLCTFIGSLSNILCVDFRFQKISDADQQSLIFSMSKKECLSRLLFVNVALTDSALLSLGCVIDQMLSLTSLDISENSFSEVALFEFGCLLLKSKSLLNLKIGSESISQQALLRFFQSIQIHNNLQVLHVTSLDWSPQFQSYLFSNASASKSLIRFSFDAKKISSDRFNNFLQCLPKLNGIRVLKFDDDFLSTEHILAVCKAASCLDSLVKIFLGRNKVDLKAAKALVSLIAIQSKFRTLKVEKKLFTRDAYKYFRSNDLLDCLAFKTTEFFEDM